MIWRGDRFGAVPFPHVADHVLHHDASHQQQHSAADQADHVPHGVWRFGHAGAVINAGPPPLRAGWSHARHRRLHPSPVSSSSIATMPELAGAKAPELKSSSESKAMTCEPLSDSSADGVFLNRREQEVIVGFQFAWPRNRGIGFAQFEQFDRSSRRVPTAAPMKGRYPWDRSDGCRCRWRRA